MKRVEARQKLSTAEKIAVLSEVGVVLLTALDETHLGHFIAQTACKVTDAAFAAFSLRSVNEEGQALVPSEGKFFHPVAVVGVTYEQEVLLRQMLLGADGLLAPIFRQGVPVLVADVLTFVPPGAPAPSALGDASRPAASDAALRDVPVEDMHPVGIPPGHPLVRSFLGVPVLTSQGEVRGGLLVGHREPGHFILEDKGLLMGLATQAAMALENARLSGVGQRRAAVVEDIFASLGDGVTLVNERRRILYENAAARLVREQLESRPGGRQAIEALLYTPAQYALQQEGVKDLLVQLEDEHCETREYAVSASLLPLSVVPTGPSPADPGSLHSLRWELGAVVTWHDVTERRMREAEHRARASAEQLETINEAIADAVFLVDPAGQLVHANAAARRWLMHDPSKLPTGLREADIATLLPRDPTGQPLAPAQRPTQRVLNGESLTGNQTVDVVYRTMEGRDLLFNVSGTPVRDGNGNLLGALMIARDVTERRRAEETLLGQARQLRRQADLIELAHDAIVVLDPHDVIVSWNRGAEALYGWSASEAKGQVISTLLQTRFPLPQEDLERVLQQEGRWEGELVHTRRDGVQVIVESRQVLVRDEAGRPMAVLEINRDMTERRRLEQVERQVRAEMEDRLHMLRLILDELPSGVYLVYGRDARLLLANRATTAIWGATWPPGQPMEEFLTQSGVGLLDRHEQPLAFEQLATVRAVRHGQTVRQFQTIVRQPTGTTLSVLVNAVALDAHRLKLSLLQPGGLPLEEPADAALVSFQDVIVLKEAERLKDQFIGTAAHELRHPLAVLKGYVDMLLLQHKRGRRPTLFDSEQVLQSIDRSTRQLVELTEDLLDVTRLQEGKVALHCKPTDLVALVQRTVEHLRMTTSHHTLTVVTTLPSLVVDADPVRIERVLSNLIGNAIKYSPEGGPVEITLSEAVDAQEARVSIRDCGIGIPEQDQARIFGQFVRAGNAESYGIGGTGLGLYLCRELVERHHGRIWFESREGQGTTFFVALPHTCDVTGFEAPPDAKNLPDIGLNTRC